MSVEGLGMTEWEISLGLSLQLCFSLPQFEHSAIPSKGHVSFQLWNRMVL